MFNRRFRKDTKKENIKEPKEEKIEEYTNYSEEDVEDYNEVEEYEVEEEENEQQEFHDDGLFANNKKVPSFKVIYDIVFILVLLCMIFITVDVIAVGKYDKGPFFAIPFRTYKDGGTKEYYGLGYKVIKYNQVQGRRDKEIGFWTLKYNTDAINVQDVDLAIEFNENNEEKVFNKYYKKFLRIPSTLYGINVGTTQMTLGYHDEDGKYSMDIVCTMAPEMDLSTFEPEKPITIIGTVRDYKGRTATENNTLYMSDCFGQQ